MSENSEATSQERPADDEDGPAVTSLALGGLVDRIGHPVGVESVVFGPPHDDDRTSCGEGVD